MTIDPTRIVHLQVTLRNGVQTVIKAGDVATVGVVVSNMTNADVVHLDPLDPTLTGNVGLANPIDPDKPPPTDAYPVAVDPTLGPGDVKALTADAATVQSAGTRGTVQFSGHGQSRSARR